MSSMEYKRYKMFRMFPKQRKWWMQALGLALVMIFIALSSLYSVEINGERDRKLEALRSELDSLVIKHNAVKEDLTKLTVDNLSHEPRNRKKRAADEPRHMDDYSGLGGATYIRWGRMSCPLDNETELVYKGIGGGSHYTHEGGADVQCLPNEPEWGRFDDGSTACAYMYGMEYEDNMDNILDHSNIAGTLANQNVPCAVCRSKVRPSALMIPGKFGCFEGWKLEYRGYIMAGHYTHKAASQYICLDEAPEADPAGFRDENGALLYRVEIQCGSLPCPQYVQNRELPCAVCTR